MKLFGWFKRRKKKTYVYFDKETEARIVRDFCKPIEGSVSFGVSECQPGIEEPKLTKPLSFTEVMILADDAETAHELERVLRYMIKYKYYYSTIQLEFAYDHFDEKLKPFKMQMINDSI